MRHIPGAPLERHARMHKNNVAHFEIYADNPEKLSHFYTSLFDWDIEEVPAAAGMEYRVVHTVDTDGQNRPSSPGAINGGIAKRPNGYGVNGAVNYVSVDSIEASVEKAKRLGARVTKGKTAVPGMGWFAMLTDPEGNNFAVWKEDSGAH